MNTIYAWFDRTYDRFAKVLLIFCLLAATGGVIIGTTATVANARQDQADSKIVKCLNKWSTQNAAVNKEVREAAAAKDVAVTAFNSTLADEGEAFLDLVQALVDPATQPEDYDKLLQTLERTLQLRADANYEVILAQNELDQVREDYPVPPPPSIYCDLNGD